jgi:type VI secretion system ImpM family protein
VVFPVSGGALDDAGESASGQRPRPILFGKSPGQGDFISRGLEDGARAMWDDWASRAMSRARDALGDRFDAAHESAPPWCFVSGPCDLGAGWRVGAIAPSQDSAGRRFLIAAGLDGLSFPEAAILSASAQSYFIDVIYRLFSERMDADSAAGLLAEPLKQMTVATSAALSRVVEACAPGVWWPHMDGDPSPWILCRAEPDEDLFLRMLSLAIGDLP